MLILTRRPGEGLTIRLDPSIDPSTPIGEILGQAGIHVRVVAGRSNQVRVGIDAPAELVILRDELVLAEALTRSD